MKRLRRTEIRIEHREISIFLAGRPSVEPGRENCPMCAGPCFPADVDEVATALGVDPWQVRLWLTEGRIHGYTSRKGQLLICATSLIPSAPRESRGPSPRR